MEKAIGSTGTIGAAAQTNDLYEAAARRFEALFDGIPVSCLTFDQSGLVFEWNRASEELWERTSTEAFQEELARVLRRGSDDLLICDTVERVFQGESLVNLEWSADFPDGRSKWVVANAFPVRSPDGKITGGVMACVDITARKQLQQQVEAQLLEISEAQILLEYQRDRLSEANAKLKDLATTDGLTGLKNHRSFQEFLEQQFAIARRSKAHLSMLLLDVDNFKLLNDTHGHPAGDRVLRGLGTVLLDLGRKSDFIARYGGEEFVVILPDTDAKGALEAAERFRSAVEAHPFKVGAVTASFGCSTIKPSDKNRQEMIARADTALYASKRAGRNRSTHSNELKEAA